MRAVELISSAVLFLSIAGCGSVEERGSERG